MLLPYLLQQKNWNFLTQKILKVIKNLLKLLYHTFVNQLLSIDTVRLSKFRSIYHTPK